MEKDQRQSLCNNLYFNEIEQAIVDLLNSGAKTWQETCAINNSPALITTCLTRLLEQEKIRQFYDKNLYYAIAKNMSGKFIVIEGPEGSGKTSLQVLVAQYLRQQGLSVLETREPGETELGNYLRTFLLHNPYPLDPISSLMLFLADRREHIAKIIQPAIAENKIVVCDRFTYSTVAHQGYGLGIDLSNINQLNYWITDGLKPDLTIFLLVEPATGLKRKRNIDALDAIESKTSEYHEKVLNAYKRMSEEDKAIHVFETDKQSPTGLWLSIKSLLDFKLKEWQQ